MGLVSPTEVLFEIREIVPAVNPIGAEHLVAPKKKPAQSGLS
jgi:hypothetical protein